MVTFIIIIIIIGLFIEALPWIIGIVVVGLIVGLIIEYGKKELKKEDMKNKEIELRNLHRQIEEYGLPSVQTTLMLSPRERCHYHDPATRLIISRRVTRYEGKSTGYSVRVAKGFTVRQGASRGTPIRQDVTDRYEGTLAVTNRRIVFLGNKGFEFFYRDITAMEEYNDAIDFQVGKNRYIISSPDIKKVQLIINTIMN